MQKLTLYVIFCIAIFIAYLMPFHIGIIPREISLHSVLGILLSWLFHADFNHLKNNMFLLSQLMIVFLIAENKPLKDLFVMIILSGLFTWVFGYSGQHIGASGLIFSLIGYILSRSFFVFSKNNSIIYFAVTVLFSVEIMWYIFHGTINVSPFSNISISAHVGGLVTGFIYGLMKKEKHRNKKQRI